jgi:serine protease Do
MRRLILFLIFLAGVKITLANPDEAVWQKIYNLANENIVNIEYYEELESSGSIINGNKIKRNIMGIIVSKDGLVLTSSSIYKAKLGFSGTPHFGTSTPPSDISVRLNSGEKIKAEFIGKDDDKNVAFIKLQKPVNNNGISFSAPTPYAIGQKIFIVFQLDEEYDYEIMILEKNINSIFPGPPQKLISDVTPQAEFGLVCDMEGNPLGIIENSKMTSGFSFDFRPAVKNFVQISLASGFTDLIKNPPKFERKNTSRKKWLGVNMQPFTREMADYFNADSVRGILINTILEESPAEDAQMEEGDVITVFNGVPIRAENNNDLQLFRNMIREFNDEKAELTIWRKGKYLRKQIELAELPISQYLADEVSNKLLGFTAKELTKDIILAKQLSFDVNGVWISKVERAGWADLSGLTVGDLLLKIDNEDLQDIKQLDDYLSKIEKSKPKYINFFVKRRSETRFLFIKTNFN